MFFSGCRPAIPDLFTRLWRYLMTPQLQAFLRRVPEPRPRMALFSRAQHPGRGRQFGAEGARSKPSGATRDPPTRPHSFRSRNGLIRTGVEQLQANSRIFGAAIRIPGCLVGGAELRGIDYAIPPVKRSGSRTAAACKNITEAHEEHGDFRSVFRRVPHLNVFRISRNRTELFSSPRGMRFPSPASSGGSRPPR